MWNVYSAERIFMLQVKRLQLQLQEEIDLHTFLESVMEKDPWELSSTSSVPHPVCSLNSCYSDCILILRFCFS